MLGWCVPVVGCIAPMRAVYGWFPGVPETAPAEKTPHPPPRQAGLCRSLAAHPPTHGGARKAPLDFGRCQPLFVCPPPHPRGGWGFVCLSACLVWSPPIRGEMSSTIAYGPW